MQFLRASCAKTVESIQARKIRVKLSIADQGLDRKKRKKCKEIKAAIWQAIKISQPTKFRRLRKLHPTDTVHHVHCSSSSLFSCISCPSFFCYIFFVSSYFNPCNCFCFGLFCNFPYTEHLYKPQSVQTLYQSTSINKVTGEASCSPAWLLLSSASLSFVLFSIFSVAKHPLMMTNQRMFG